MISNVHINRNCIQQLVSGATTYVLAFKFCRHIIDGNWWTEQNERLAFIEAVCRYDSHISLAHSIKTCPNRDEFILRATKTEHKHNHNNYYATMRAIVLYILLILIKKTNLPIFLLQFHISHFECRPRAYENMNVHQLYCRIVVVCMRNSRRNCSRLFAFFFLLSAVGGEPEKKNYYYNLFDCQTIKIAEMVNLMNLKMTPLNLEHSTKIHPILFSPLSAYDCETFCAGLTVI